MTDKELLSHLAHKVDSIIKEYKSLPKSYFTTDNYVQFENEIFYTIKEINHINSSISTIIPKFRLKNKLQDFYLTTYFRLKHTK